MARTWMLMGGLLALLAQPAGTQPAPPDVRALGPQVGEAVPDFTLVDQHGVSRTRASLMGPKGLMLVFSRSAGWCPYCKTQMAELQTRLEDLRRSGLGVAVITYDAVPVLAEFATRRGITYPVLSDSGSATIRRFGILNTTIPSDNAMAYGIPFPGTFLLDARGVVTSRFFEPAYQERVTVGSVLARLGNGLDVPTTRVASAQLAVQAYSTDLVVAPGSNFSLVLDIAPGRGMHVYAPGAAGYRPIALTVTLPDHLQAKGTHLPEAEEYYFEPLKERVPVFQRPFRLVQDVSVAADPQAQAALRALQTVTVRGTLAYQACDDRICYAPQRVSLEWTVGLRTLDTERARP